MDVTFLRKILFKLKTLFVLVFSKFGGFSKTKGIILGVIVAVIAVSSVALLYPVGEIPGIEITCSDSDGERLPGVKGVCKDVTGEAEDTCLDGEELMEYVCQDNVCNSVNIKCSTFGMICVDGKCKKETQDFYENDTNEPEIVENDTIVEENKTFVEEIVNETNTTQNASLARIPDLVITSINYYKINETGWNLTLNETTNATIVNESFFNLSLYISVAINNSGNYPAPKSGLNVSLSGPVNEYTVFSVPKMFVGDVRIMSTTVNLGNETGTYKIWAGLDWANKIEELDEDNNYMSVTFPI